MEQRLDYPRLAPEATRAMYGSRNLPRRVRAGASLLELVKIRASQINGCAFCIDMHTKDARAAGETEQRIYALNAWRETPFFTDRERAALAWTEAVTRIGGGVPDDLYAEARRQFSEKELVDLTWAVAAINAWNRVAISFRSVPGLVPAEEAPRLRPDRPPTLREASSPRTAPSRAASSGALGISLNRRTGPGSSPRASSSTFRRSEIAST